MNENKMEKLDSVVIRFSGDSGDGMQLTGTLFSSLSAILGNEITTFPDYPAEIRCSWKPNHRQVFHQKISGSRRRICFVFPAEVQIFGIYKFKTQLQKSQKTCFHR